MKHLTPSLNPEQCVLHPEIRNRLLSKRSYIIDVHLMFAVMTFLFCFCFNECYMGGVCVALLYHPPLPKTNMGMGDQIYRSSKKSAGTIKFHHMSYDVLTSLLVPLKKKHNICNYMYHICYMKNKSLSCVLNVFCLLKLVQ